MSYQELGGEAMLKVLVFLFIGLIISITIIVVIVSLDFFTQNYTNDSIKQTTIMLDDLKEKIKKDNNISNIDELANSWENRRKKLAYFIEHDELEKVDTNLTNLKSYIEVSDLEMAINSIDEAKYILEHIKQKSSFSLVNVF